MLTLIIAFFSLWIVAGAARLACKLLGWTLRAAVNIVLLPVLIPLWIIAALAGGVSLALQALVPVAIIAFVASLFIAD